MRIADLSEPMWDLLFAVRTSSRYHDRRKRFFTFLHRSTAAVGVLFGTAAVAAFVGQLSPRAGMVAAVIITAMSVLDLVVGFSAGANLHHDLKRRFIELEQAIIHGIDDALLGEYQRRKLDIEKDEPTPKCALVSLCYNDIVRAEYSPQDVPANMIAVPWWRRLTAQWV